MADFKLPDPKKTSGKVLGLTLLGVGGLAVWYYLVPILAAMAWSTVSLMVALAVIGLLATILLSKKFWKRLDIVLQALGNILFGWFVEMNPFTILDLQLDRFEKDRQELFAQAGKLKAQETALSQQLEAQNKIMTLAAKKMQLTKQAMDLNPLDDEAQYSYQSASVEFTNSKGFIDNVGPVRGDIARLVIFADKAYRKSGYALKDARSTVEAQRTTYKAVTAGQNAMTKALRAFTGDPEMNKAADIALAKLKTDIADKIGTIKNCIAETSRVMNERDLNDAAKVRLAADKIETLNIDSKFNYVEEVTGKGDIQIPVANKWLEPVKQA